MKELMILVERAVRPVHASRQRKQRMREEMLTHVTEIYNQEFARFNEPQAAIQETARRFGEPAELTRELQATVGFSERVTFAFERRFGWRPGEAATRFLLRQAMLLLLFNLLAVALIVTAITGIEGPFDDPVHRLRPGIAFILVCSIDLFVLGLLQFKMRDALLGTPWATKSRRRAVGFGLLFGLTVYASVFVFGAIADLELPTLLDLFHPVGIAIVLLLPVLFGVLARIQGPGQIRYVEWVSLDIGE